MRLSFLPGLLLGCGYIAMLFALSYYHQPAELVANAYPSQNETLQLETSIIDQKYCKGDAELDGVRMNLRLKFTNTGAEPLILYKGSNQVTKVIVSRSREDAMAQRPEINSSLTQATSGGKITLNESAPGRMFVVLKPGESFETKAIVGVFVVRDESNQIGGSVKSGEHVLQIEVPTWPESKRLADKLRQRWRRSGHLWHNPIASQPMQFKIEKQRKVENCP